MTTAVVEVEYQTEHGTVKLTPDIIKRYLVSGDASNVTAQEIMLFMTLNKYQKLNPFLRESYLIKFGNSPATMVVGKDVFVKRAAANPHYNGSESGIIVRTPDGKLEQRVGTFRLKEEELVGGWSKVYRKNWDFPTEISVTLSEYERRKNDGGLQKNWKEMPATMIRKVALSQALREAFPEDFEGLYTEEEMPVDPTLLDTKPVVVKDDEEIDEEGDTLITFEQADTLLKEVAGGDTDAVKEALTECGFKNLSQVPIDDYEKVKALIESKVATDVKPEDPELSQMEL